MKKVFLGILIALISNCVPFGLSAQNVTYDYLNIDGTFGLVGKQIDSKESTMTASCFVNFNYPLSKKISINPFIRISNQKSVGIRFGFLNQNLNIGVATGTSTLNSEFELINRLSLKSCFKLRKFVFDIDIEANKKQVLNYRLKIISPEIMSLFQIGIYSEKNKIHGLLLSDFIDINERVNIYGIFGSADANFEQMGLIIGLCYNMRYFQTIRGKEKYILY